MRTRRVTRLVIVAAVTTLLVSGCGDSDTDTSPAITELPTTAAPVAPTTTAIPITLPPSTTSAPVPTTTVPPTTSLPPTTTTAAAATTSTTVTTTITTTTTVPPPPGGYVVGTPSLFPPDPLPGSEGASGSGCSPGGAVLPDGIWFGFVAANTAGEIGFDLACFYFGDIAHEKAAAVGQEAPNDFFISNVNPSLRTISAPADLPVFWISDAGNEFATAPYDEWRSDPAGYSNCPGEFCLVWLYINGGSVTEVMEQYTP